MASDWLRPIPGPAKGPTQTSGILSTDLRKVQKPNALHCRRVKGLYEGRRRLPAAGNKGNLNPDKNYEISRPPQAASLIIILMGMVMAMVIGIMTTNTPTPYVAEPVSSF